MTSHEPRCLVCGAPLGRGAPFEKDVRDSETCSDECYAVYMHDENEEEDLRLFIRDVTLLLQTVAYYNPKKIEPMFQRAYKLYVKYKVEKQGMRNDVFKGKNQGNN